MRTEPTDNEKHLLHVLLSTVAPGSPERSTAIHTEAPEHATTMHTNNEKHLLQILEMETSRISSLDSTIFTIKGWSVTLVSALVGFSFTSTPTGGSILSKGLLWVAMLSALIFMIIDIHFRKVQSGDVATVRRIRKLLIEINANRVENGEQNIWLVVWKDKYGIKKQYRSKPAELFWDYLFTVLPYIVVVTGLTYLIRR